MDASMDRFPYLVVTLSFCLFLPALAAGEMTLTYPATEKDDSGEIYPESRFGQPAPRVITGLEAGYVAREVEDMYRGGRSPAGVSSKGGHGAGTSVNALAVPSTPEFRGIAEKRKGVQEFALIAGDLGFFPKVIFVTRDIPVRLFVTGVSKNTLCIMMDPFQIRKQIRPQKIEEISFVPSYSGQYRFYCPVNGMEGTMIVKDYASIPAAQQ